MEFTYRIKRLNRSWPSHDPAPWWEWPRVGQGRCGKPFRGPVLPSVTKKPGQASSELGGHSVQDRSGGGGAGEAGSGSPERRRETGRPHGHTWSRGDTRRCSPFGPQLRVLRAAQVQPCHPPEPSVPGTKSSCSTHFSSVQSLSRVRLFATPWTAAHPASLSITNSWSLPKLMSMNQ